MPRRKTIDHADETVFSYRFCVLMDSHQPKLTQEEMGKILGVSKSSIGFYRDGTNQPNYSILIKIANYFHCSTDYLLGVSEYRGLEPQLKMICDYIGLPEHTIKELRSVFADPYEDRLIRERRLRAFSCFAAALELPDFLDSIQQTLDLCDGIAAFNYDAQPVEELDLGALKAEEYSIREDIDKINYQTYKETEYWRILLSKITGIDEVLEKLKTRLGMVCERLSQLSSDQFLQRFKKGDYRVVNETKDN